VIRRCLLHVLPSGLMRIRHYGVLASRCRAKRVEEIRVDIAALGHRRKHSVGRRVAAGVLCALPHGASAASPSPPQ
jgi:hypothetical protein